jgi:hypothetical protein
MPREPPLGMILFVIDSIYTYRGKMPQNRDFDAILKKTTE